MFKWQILDRTLLLERSPWLKVWQEKIRLLNGTIIDDYFTLDLPEYALVIAYTKKNEIVYERSYKHGPQTEVITIPGGYLKKEEEPLVAAKRELFEETGYRGDNWQHLGTFFVDGNRGAGKAHFFLANGVFQTKLNVVNSDLEEITVLTSSTEEFRGMIQRNEVKDISVVAAFFLALDKQIKY